MLCHVIRGALLAAAVIAAPMAAQAQQDYPNQPIKLIVPFPPGGGTDLSGRTAAEYLSQKLGQNVVIENRPGAATQVGMDFVAKAKPDGYTLIWTTSDGMSILPAVKPTVPFKIPESYEWVAGAATYDLAVTVNAGLPFKTLKELIDHAKANPGKVRYGTSGVGAGGHLATERIAHAAGIQMLHVPYQGAGPAVQGTAGGFVELTLVSPPSVKGQVDAGKLRVLANTDKVRSRLFPDAPTLHESGLKDLYVILYYGLLAPAGTPEPIVQKLRSAVEDMMKDEKMAARFRGFGFTPAFIGGNAFKDFIVKDLATWREVAKQAKIEIKD